MGDDSRGDGMRVNGEERGRERERENERGGEFVWERRILGKKGRGEVGAWFV